ncbi:glycosyltransferase family 2 protein [Inquilinus sp. OTU3971]|uniref:glycosyltransferase family 2 protein n=1 Tax=Inquilinus sp. OTU3971 TaxID=3043855 RepID=UPI00313AC8C2
MSISVLILTLNEEINLPGCLAAVAWSDDIVVLDSGSTDRTVEIARAAGARVHHRVQDNEHAQRTYGLQQIEFKHPWVYMPDADEITPPELRDEMLAIAADPDRPEVLFRVRFKNIFMGRWIRHSSLYPTWVVRLVRPEKISFERQINLQCVADGAEGRLQSHFYHYSFNKGLNAWYEKHNRYSWFEAQESLKSLRQGGFKLTDIFSRRSELRRRALKELSFRMPFRPALRFLYMYFIRRGFLDGMPGYLYCRLLTAYEYMIVVKMMEIRRREQGQRV